MNEITEYFPIPLNWGDFIAALFVVGLFCYAWWHTRGKDEE
jgi:hypothetical protein